LRLGHVPGRLEDQDGKSLSSEECFLMLSRAQNSCGRVAVVQLAVIALLCSVGTFTAAQDQPTPKWELYAGYSFFDPATHVHGLLPGGVLPATSRVESNPHGIGGSVTYNFNRWFGLTADGSGHWGSGENGVGQRIDDAAFYSASAGPKLTLRGRHVSPFVEALVGWHSLASDLFQSDNRFGFMAGGGLDVNLTRHFALRLIRGDYVFSNHQYGPNSIVPATDVRGVRLQSGVVFMLGGKEPSLPVSASCTITPNQVMVGEPLTVNAVGSNFNPKHTLNYTWSTTGGNVTGKDNTASVDTNGVAGGSYTVTAHISDPRMQTGGQASCMASFAVKEPPKNPPAISCSANPSTVQTGASATISCTCSSPDNASVTVAGWSTTGGNVSGSGNSASLNTSGAPAGPITVSATCSDSRGLNTPATAQVMVENPPAPSPEFVALESRLALHSIYFPTGQPMPTNPQAGLLPSQQRTLTALADDFKKYLETKPDAHLTLEGHADPRGSVEYNQELSERRVERTKSFLIEHGVPAANLDTKAFGVQRNLTADQVKDAVEKNPELTPEQRRRVLANRKTILLASNRRVDITLSTTGQQSVREYPFNAADSLTLLKEEGSKKTARPAAKRKAKPKGQP
jgi:outer membrane protein OmpA-like peptidoglycan-associated protein/opacity protein-like surface antigen